MTETQKNLKSLRYVILPGKGLPGSEGAQIHDRAYAYWKRFWSEIYTQAGCPESFAPEDFFRQDFIPVLLCGDEIVAMHLYTVFHLPRLATQVASSDLLLCLPFDEAPRPCGSPI